MSSFFWKRDVGDISVEIIADLVDPWLLITISDEGTSGEFQITRDQFHRLVDHLQEYVDDNL